MTLLWPATLDAAVDGRPGHTRRSRKPDDEPSPLLRRLGGNGLAHLRSRVSQRPSAPRTQLPDLRVGPGCSPRVELPIELAQTLVRRAQRIELEYLIPQTKHVRDRPTRHDASYRRRAPPRHHSVSCSPLTARWRCFFSLGTARAPGEFFICDAYCELVTADAHGRSVSVPWLSIPAD